MYFDTEKMPKEEFNLSEFEEYTKEAGVVIKIGKVKEFIKREDEIIDDYIKGKIDEAELVCRRLKLAGDKLSK